MSQRANILFRLPKPKEDNRLTAFCSQDGMSDFDVKSISDVSFSKLHIRDDRGKILSKNGKPYAIVVNAGYNYARKKYEQYKIKTLVDSHDVEFGVIVGESVRIYGNGVWISSVNDNLIFQVLNGEKKIDSIYKDRKLSTLNGILKNISNGKFKGLVNTLDFNMRNKKCSFREDYEKLFWNILLEGEIKARTKVFRYTTLDTLYNTLNSQEYWIQGIVGMNDKSEVDYFDKYCGITPSERYVKENNIFIMSCNPEEEDLTMWRLYSGQAEGVCFVFNVKEVSSQNHLLYKVSYADKNGVDSKLEIVKKLIENGLDFNEIDKWKHFFKAYDYSIEKEIRLLYEEQEDGKIEWMKLNSNSIINPYIKKSKDEIPLELKKIILGPLSQEKETNKIQSMTLAQKKAFGIEGVEISKIKNFRK